MKYFKNEIKGLEFMQNQIEDYKREMRLKMSQLVANVFVDYEFRATKTDEINQAVTLVNDNVILYVTPHFTVKNPNIAFWVYVYRDAETNFLMGRKFFRYTGKGKGKQMLPQFYEKEIKPFIDDNK